MIKQLVSAAAACSLCACTAQLKEDSFIGQSESVTNYSESEIKAFRDSFPGYEVKTLDIAGEDESIRLRGIYLDAPESNDMILFFPGNGMTVKGSGLKAMDRLKGTQRDLVFFDRRGLGASEGKASISNLVADAKRKLDYVKNTYQPDSVVVHGLSLGSFVAGQLAKEADIQALVLEGSATNVDEWIDEGTPWYAKLFLTIEVDDAFYAVDNKDVLANHYSGPLLVIGAEKDEQVAPELSVRLYEASQSENKKLMMVEGATHGTILNGEAEQAEYRAFLDAIGK